MLRCGLRMGRSAMRLRTAKPTLQPLRQMSTANGGGKPDSSRLFLIGSTLVFAGAASLVVQEIPGLRDSHADEVATAVVPSAIVNEEAAAVAPSDAVAAEPVMDIAPAEPVPDATAAPAAAVTPVSEYHATYVLVGGGTASFAAAKAILEKDKKAKILIVAEEYVSPYSRPPLSKELWFSEFSEVDKLQFTDWAGKQRDVVYKPADFYCTPEELKTRSSGIALLTGSKAVKLELKRRRVVLANGTKITFDKCLLATGATPKSLPIFENAGVAVNSHVMNYRTISDFQKLDALTRAADKDQTIVIVGGSFLGSELAVALAHRSSENGKRLRVVQVYAERNAMAKVFPRYLAEWTSARIEEQGVQLIPEARVVEASSNHDGTVLLRLSNGQEVNTDHVIVALGVEPNVELARAAGLEVDEVRGGVVVNAELEARSNVWVAGDLSSFHDIALGRRRVEHHDHAVVSGRLAGENMAGSSQPYSHQSMFWSDLGPKIGYEAIGIIDSALPTVGVWAKASADDTPQGALMAGDTSHQLSAEAPVTADLTAAADPAATTSQQTASSEPGDANYGKGVVFYLRNDKVVGVLLWNVFNQTAIARRVLRQNRTVADINDVANLFNIHQ